MSRGDLDYELRRERLTNKQSRRRGRERDETLRRVAGWSIVLLALISFLFVLNYHPVRRQPRRDR